MSPPLSLAWRPSMDGVRSAAFQAAIAAGVVGLLALLARNVAAELERLGLNSGFAFLAEPVTTSVANPIIANPEASALLALFAGLANTVQVALIACAAATALGTVFGTLASLSNPVVRTLAVVPVQLLRNTPFLLQLIMLYTLALALPSIRDAWDGLPGFILSNRGIYTPALGDGAIVLAFGVLAALVLPRLVPAPGPGAGLGALVQNLARRPVAILVAAAVLAVAVAELSLPEQEGRRVTGGARLGLEFATLLIALTLYKGAQVAEIVRGAINSVPQGQTDAAQAMGLSPLQTYRLVVLPYALRIVIPPLTNTFTDIIKMTSLGVAIGYAELTAVGQRIVQITAQPVETIAVIMLLYFIVCLITATAMDAVNRAIAFKGHA